MITKFNEVSIAQTFITALEYGDTSGLSDEDEKLVTEYMESLPACATFEYSEETDFCRDDITGLMADCVEVSIYAPAE